MKKPSNIKSLEAKKNKLLCWPGYKYFMFCGVLYTRTEETFDEINRTEGIDSVDENHEMIHVKQAVSTKDCWLLYYLTYICQWIYNLPLIFVNSRAPYKFTPMELEAYGNQENMEYLDGRESCIMWKTFRKLTMKDRRKFAKMYYKERKYTFSDLINNEIKPYLGIVA